MMSQRSIFSIVLRGGGGAVIGVYVVLDSIFGPILRPLTRFLVRSAPIAMMERGVARLPPYAALAALALPFIIAEPAKIFGLYLIGDRHYVSGAITIMLAYLVSLLVVDRIYEAARPQLFTIRWFAALMGWIIELRDDLTARVKKTRAWQWAREQVRRLKSRLARVI
jgi:hypothetical protein